MGDYSKMTDDDFDRILLELVEEEKASTLLQIPGVYEVVSEYFNNEVLSMWDDEQG